MLQKCTIRLLRVHHILRYFFVFSRSFGLLVLKELEVLVLNIGKIYDVDSAENNAEEEKYQQ